MKKALATHLEHAFDQLNYVQFVMQQILFWENCLSDELARSITVDFILGKYQNTKSFERKELFEFISERVTLQPVTASLFIKKKKVFSKNSENFSKKYHKKRTPSERQPENKNGFQIMNMR